jgi:hypothetical protein
MFIFELAPELTFTTSFGSDDLSFPENSIHVSQSHDSFGQTLDAPDAWEKRSATLNCSNDICPRSSVWQQTIHNCDSSVQQQCGETTPLGEVIHDVYPTTVNGARAAEQEEVYKSQCTRSVAAQQHAKAERTRNSHLKRPEIKTGWENDRDDISNEGKHGEKNSLAARACRTKREGNIMILEDNYQNFSVMNSILKEQAQELREELVQLRAQALNHQYCRCQVAKYNISQAQETARRLVRSSPCMTLEGRK